MTTVPEGPSWWEYLPDTVLISVFTLLPDADRARAACVCKRWKVIFNTPSLWRSRTVTFHDDESKSSNGVKEFLFATWFGKYLKKLSFVWNRPAINELITQAAVVQILLGTLVMQETQLTTLDLYNLQIYLDDSQETGTESLLCKLIEFLHTQKSLQDFTLSLAGLTKVDGLRLLESIASQSGETLENLQLVNCFKADIDVAQLEELPIVMEKFTSLRTIDITYCYLSDELLGLFSRTLRTDLNALIFRVYKDELNFQNVISASAWKHFSNACSRAFIGFAVDGADLTVDMTSLLSPEAPLLYLALQVDFGNTKPGSRLEEYLHHIAKCYANVLEGVHLDVYGENFTMDTDVIQLVTDCKRIDRVVLEGAVSMETVKHLYKLQQASKIDLTSLHVIARFPPGQANEKAKLMELQEIYRPMVSESNRDFKITLAERTDSTT